MKMKKQRISFESARKKENQIVAVVVAQLVERSLPIPEVRGSNPVIGKNLFICLLSTVY